MPSHPNTNTSHANPNTHPDNANVHAPAERVILDLTIATNHDRESVARALHQAFNDVIAALTIHHTLSTPHDFFICVEYQRRGPPHMFPVPIDCLVPYFRPPPEYVLHHCSLTLSVSLCNPAAIQHFCYVKPLLDALSRALLQYSEP
ncbi:uncharacterized protein MELLADRAFT_105783 [Melampsora larici-populina 98AG31]|uniref:Uncharacterized protein n=1 Tax=Melampsora larici-populina (strain 98AG31 / pathotype 3-4-7) TaxID=747676 RepID=F4RJB8_MELLP|nr:uncharacterized protein MELLADRAFT_105783 [Melampsora larici-populina 98AG31]EGG07286.1 hypothetical protein MELLADRAFT_105783 [Melampsora larici-populina 98AG31]